ncbi:N-alpha-acetyltransferase, non-catalitic subunit [Coemansia guatemalensis]|uniref:N-alpha-acetyltransferase, non-catalitic subunit n=1 Tax=Coemansia guatemalensis TaxID=2761395 RepID=A0A9W8LUE4_9FUNG|nr:N-alpha-acetyltransferase, non-catalitic subunit [Coemansia guatemalensis]
MADDGIDEESTLRGVAGLTLEAGEEWINITELMDRGTKALKEGELVKAAGFGLFDAMTSIEVMDPRLDMGMETEENKAEMAHWDIGRRLTLAQTLWIIEQVFSSEMTWHSSAALVQTLYTCNYITADRTDISIGSGAQNPERDMVLYPLLVATGACCQRVWDEYTRGNVYGDEDVFFSTMPPQPFDGTTEADARRLLEVARAHLATYGDDAAARLLRMVVGLREQWLDVLCRLGDANAWDQAMAALAQLSTAHAEYVRELERDDTAALLADGAVRGVFDRRCMRWFPAAAPVKPRELLEQKAAHTAFARLLDDLRQVGALRCASGPEHVERLLLSVARAEAALPYARSLLASAADARMHQGESTARFVRQAAIALVGEPLGIPDDVFVSDATSLLGDWCRAMCQNPARRRRVALKLLGAWDALQSEAEREDMRLFAEAHPREPAAAAGDPERNSFSLSSWAYHSKLLLAETALLGGVRLDVYHPHELPAVFCAVSRLFDAHSVHLARAEHRAGSSYARRGQLLASAQRDVATAVWLTAHVCGRLGLVRPPWRSTSPNDAVAAIAASRALDEEPARRARHMLRFRAFAQLASPAGLDYDSLCAAEHGVDAHTLTELLAHARRLLDDTSATLAQCRVDSSSEDQSAAAAVLWAEECEALRHVAVANSIALARLLRCKNLATAEELAVTGSEALRRSMQGSDPVPSTADAQSSTRGGRRRRRNRARAHGTEEATARQWNTTVERLIADAGVRVQWTCDTHNPDWPVVSFFD